MALVRSRDPGWLQFAVWATLWGTPIGSQANVTISPGHLECSRSGAGLTGSPPVVHDGSEVLVMRLWLLPRPGATVIEVRDANGKTVDASPLWRRRSRVISALEQAGFRVRQHTGWIAPTGPYSARPMIATLAVVVAISLVLGIR
jgi:hypothetical protein